METAAAEQAAIWVWMALIIVPAILAFAGCAWCAAALAARIREDRFWASERKIWEDEMARRGKHHLRRRTYDKEPCVLKIPVSHVEDARASGYGAVAYDGAVWCFDCLPEGAVMDDTVPITDWDGWVFLPICAKCGHMHGYAIERRATSQARQPIY